MIVPLVCLLTEKSFLTVVAQLERYLYANHMGYERPRVKVGNMLDGVDAIRHYSQLLDDLNKTIASEQAVAKRLASPAKSISLGNANTSSKLSGKVLDEFLKVTEIGSAKRLLKESTSTKEAKKMNLTTSLSGKQSVSIDNSEYIADSYQNYPISTDFSPPKPSSPKPNASNQQQSTDEASLPRIRPFRLYRMTWYEWGWAMWTSPSFAECWRTFRDYRYAEDHSVPISQQFHSLDDENYLDFDGEGGRTAQFIGDQDAMLPHSLYLNCRV